MFISKMIIASSVQKEYKSKKQVEELLKAFSNDLISQEVLEVRLKKMKIKNLFNYLNN